MSDFFRHLRRELKKTVPNTDGGSIKIRTEHGETHWINLSGPALNVVVNALILGPDNV